MMIHSSPPQMIFLRVFSHLVDTDTHICAEYLVVSAMDELRFKLPPFCLWDEDSVGVCMQFQIGRLGVCVGVPDVDYSMHAVQRTRTEIMQAGGKGPEGQEEKRKIMPDMRERAGVRERGLGDRGREA